MKLFLNVLEVIIGDPNDNVQITFFIVYFLNSIFFWSITKESQIFEWWMSERWEHTVKMKWGG